MQFGFVKKVLDLQLVTKIEVKFLGKFEGNRAWEVRENGLNLSSHVSYVKYLECRIWVSANQDSVCL